MSSFSAILSSLQDGKARSSDEAKTDIPKAAKSLVSRTVVNVPTSGLKRKAEDDGSVPTSGLKRKAEDDGSVPTSGLKRKAEDDGSVPTRKAPQVSSQARSTLQGQSTTTNKVSIPQEKRTAYSATMKSVTKPGTIPVKSAIASKIEGTPPATTAPKAKRGFASLMERANAAQEAIKAAGPDTIKHKPTERLTKKDRLRLIEEAKEKDKQRKKGRPVAMVTNGAVPQPDKAGQRRPKLELTYTGTMRPKSGKTPTVNVKQKGQAQDKYGGYASWSDLDEAEDEEEGEYDSASDMEEVGFDDMMEEELQTEKIAKREDQRMLEEEERHKREKLERKKRLMALSSSAAAKKKY